MIKVVAKCTVKTEEIKAFKQYVTELVVKSKKDTGNISYDIYEDVENPAILTFIEEWQDKKVLDQHMSSKHFIDSFKILKPLLQKEMDINLYKKV
jgi:quinol monooxygenase YgiN